MLVNALLYIQFVEISQSIYEFTNKLAVRKLITTVYRRFCSFDTKQSMLNSVQ